MIKVFGAESFEVTEFQGLEFFYNPMVSFAGQDHTSLHIRYFREAFDITKKNISSYIEELDEELDEEPIEVNNTESKINKIFISHSSSDKVFVEEIIDLIETIGLSSTQIFCSSFDGYGIDLGEDFLKRIKNELNEEVLVLFVLSNNFYSSPICLCEMGATWIKTNEHIPILIPPFEFKDIKGVIPSTQGFKINEHLKLNLFKEKLEKLFNIPSIDNSSWERKRDKILNQIESAIKNNN